MQTLTDQEFIDYAKHLFTLIDSEINPELSQSELANRYHEFVLMYNFFRTTREYFYIKRTPILKFGEQLYEWENILMKKLVDIKNRLDPIDFAKINYLLQEYRDEFAPLQ